ncbi:MAG TPA: polyprenyl synthetase family protein, partial [Myxococcales bacterium]|nr:polyprenyl synthetase family protein [Myxococcales bacterium]
MISHRSDWPKDGPIDLAVHDLPHASSTTEWWYANTHVHTADGRRLSLFAAFFRVRAGEKGHTYSATWAISDADKRAYRGHSYLDRLAPKMGLERIRNGGGSRDARVNRAMCEILEKNSMPAPDRFFDGDISEAADHLKLNYGGLTFESTAEGYRLVLQDKRSRCAADLLFVPKKGPVRHGDDGLVRGPGGEDMFYYFIPRCEVTGTVTIQGATVPVESGQGWLDHEFGGRPADAPRQEREEVAWNWIAGQLDDGSEVTAYTLVRVKDSRVLDQRAVVIDRDGRAVTHHDVELSSDTPWRSVRTFFDYPTRWHLSVPGADLRVTLQASFEDQELVTTLSKPAFWEGRCDVEGTVGGRSVSGLAYLERSGFEPVKDLDQFFTAVGGEVRKSVARMAPLQPTPEQALPLMATEERTQYLDGVDLDQLGKYLIAPIRSITDRGGKSWRSYAALACCDVVGGDSRNFAAWLAMPELMHVGSLIVDDVQDKSTVRRGGPSCHVVYGDGLAINAGTAAYFIGQRLLEQSPVTSEQKVRIYNLYFEAMRAGHAGQALDLTGPHGAMTHTVATGDGALLESRILATHRLKTAAPAAALARMGAVAGGGTHQQVEAVGRFFEALGLAFQIVDDVLNLRGFQGNLKSRAEDIANGVITLPVAKAMSRLPHERRAALWRTLQEKSSDPVVLSATVEEL